MRKQQIVELKSIRQCAKELGIDFSTLSRWVNKAQDTIQVYKIGSCHAVLPSEIRIAFAAKLQRLGKQVAA